MAASAEPRSRVVWTYDDLMAFSDDGMRREVVDGELLVNPAPSTIHQTTSKRLLKELLRQLDDTGAGIVFFAPTDVILSDTQVVEPDLLVLLPARRNIISERGIEGPPDLVIEILSPRTAVVDRGVKRKLYATAGVSEYWLVDPAQRRVEVLRLDGGDYAVAAAHGPGATASSVRFPFSVAVDALFA